MTSLDAQISSAIATAFASNGIMPNTMATATGVPPGATASPTSAPTTAPNEHDYFVDDTKTHLPGWAIAVIVIAVLLILGAGWIIHTRVRWGYWGVGVKRLELRGRPRCATCGHVTWGGSAACARCQVVRGRAPLEMLQRPEAAVVRSEAPGSDGYYGLQARQEMRREQRAREREAAGLPPVGRDPRKGTFRNYTDTAVERMYVPFV